MKKMSPALFVSVILAVAVAAPAAARPTNGIAIGVQGGFLATGVVVDIPLGPIDVNAGVNYPVGWTYIAALAEADYEDIFAPYFTVTADVTVPIPLGGNFDLKLGINTLGFTDFSSGIFGVAGGTAKGEYWIPGRNLGLFVNLNVPVMLYLTGAGTAFEAVFNPWLPLAGLVTTTAGVLWSL